MNFYYVTQLNFGHYSNHIGLELSYIPNWSGSSIELQFPDGQIRNISESELLSMDCYQRIMNKPTFELLKEFGWDEATIDKYNKTS